MYFEAESECCLLKLLPFDYGHEVSTFANRQMWATLFYLLCPISVLEGFFFFRMPRGSLRGVFAQKKCGVRGQRGESRGSRQVKLVIPHPKRESLSRLAATSFRVSNAGNCLPARYRNKFT
jgi:hypothetical protein